MVYIKKGVRQQVRERADNKCEVCETTHPLDFHHITPWSKGGVGEAYNLQLLCKSCHTKQKISNRTHQGQLVTINVTFTSEEFSKLALVKLGMSWHDFILSIVPGD